MGQTLTRAGLQRRLAGLTRVDRRETERLIGRMLALIGEALAEGETVKLTGFGTLEVRGRAPRKGRNPKTGRVYPVAARRVVVFAPSARLRRRLESPSEPAQPVMSASVREK